MSEVSTWNAVDASNTATPPDGWPEGMQPSAVNDAARMMMGALRREHDNIVAQIGSVAGTISTTTINATTISTTGAITASGPITGTAINSTGNGSIAGTLTAGTLSTNNAGVGGNLSVGATLTAANITAAGTITAAQLTSTGNANVTGSVTVGAGVSANYVHSTGNLDAVGTVTAASGHFINATIDGTITAASGGMTMGPGGSGRVLQMASGWYWDFNPGTGDLIWGGPSGAQFWVTRFSDHYCGNQIGPVFGFGAYINASDVRGKTDISPATQGLPEILQLKPVTFKRTDQDRTELGFTAQDVQQILPEAVRPLDADKDPRLGVSLDPIVATLVHAVQQLAARIEQLEAGGTDV